MKQKKQGMKWFVFFTQVVPLVSILELIWMIILLFNPEHRKENFGTVWTSIFEVSMYIQSILVICLYFLVRKKYKYTVGYIHILLIFQTISSIYGVVIANGEINDSAYAVALLTFMTAIFAICTWYLPNIKYFTKRKWYFQNKEQDEADLPNIEEANKDDMKHINKTEKVIMSTIVAIAAITSLVSAAIIEIDSDYIDSLNEEFYAIQEKADFLDENVVFIIEGDDKYYYTYDQVMQFPDDKEYYYWVCTDAEAEELGYEKWK